MKCIPCEIPSLRKTLSDSRLIGSNFLQASMHITSVKFQCLLPSILQQIQTFLHGFAAKLA